MSAIKKKQIAALPKQDLVAMIWELKKTAERTARIFGAGQPDPYDLCVVTPSDILSTIEEYLP